MSGHELKLYDITCGPQALAPPWQEVKSGNSIGALWPFLACGPGGMALALTQPSHTGFSLRWAELSQSILCAVVPYCDLTIITSCAQRK